LSGPCSCSTEATASSSSIEANPRFIVTPLSKAETSARFLYEKVYCPRGEMENRIKECQGDLFADRTSTATLCANQLRLWLAAFDQAGACHANAVLEVFRGRPAVRRSHQMDGARLSPLDGSTRFSRAVRR
jgi:hypothetical protein